MKNIIISLIFIISLSLLNAFTNASSMALAGSYSLRANGIEACYWNPANLYDNENTGYELYLLNAGMSLSNNFLSIKLYNDINGDSLTIAKRKDILSKFDNSLNIKSNLRYSLFGYSFNQHSISVGLTATVLGKISKKYLNLVLLGNSDTYDQTYTFTKKNNDFKMLSYADLTYAASTKTLSDIIPSIDYFKWLPEIKIGYSFSFLVGLSEAELTNYSSHFSTTDSTGIHLDQNAKARFALGGYGMKMKIGFASEIYNNLNVGITFDNLIGFVKWIGKTQVAEFNVSTDSVFISNLSDNFITQSDTTYAISSYETTLPSILHFGALYKYKKASFSLDWNQNLTTCGIYSCQPEVSFGTEYYVLPYLPLRMGLALGNCDREHKFTYGIGYEVRRFTFNIGLESVSNFIPNSNSKNLSIGITSKLKW